MGPEFSEFSKLKNIEAIFGKLIINGTQLENFKFFENLKFVASFDALKPAILVENNLNLKDIQFPKLERVGIIERVIFNNNSELISTKPEFCERFKKSLKWEFDELLIDKNSCQEFRDFQFAENPKINDLGGLRNLSSIACMNINIWDNSKMKFWNLLKLKTIKYPKNVYTNKNLKIFAFDLDPEFCINSKEMEFFMSNRKLDLDYLDGKYCQLSELDSEVCLIPEVQCKHFLGNLEIGPEFSDFSILKNVEVILGNLIIDGTQLETFEFFENLKFVASLDKSKPPILVENNMNLKDIQFPKLENLTSTNPNSTKFEIYISSESPEFCITIEEMEMLLKIENSDIDHIFGKYCKPEFSETLCKKPEEKCTGYFGDLTISKYSDLNNLEFLEIIYGSLTIKETNFKNLNFLKNLKFVAQMDHKPAIIIQDNPNLVNATFPSLKVIIEFLNLRN
ncbi:hypothetical protein B9Z55_017937 [Caenorhabditis nigoni]|uniref:Receptor L-domain domain-containing protein n=1 Tax=Caenorhabditis nigoni TaxID=1611254 RepID=A0A2G5TBU8_9PELO|nr:hypothetical protein B9Z55_017937 [Caenorhabditis nigoni]